MKTEELYNTFGTKQFLEPEEKPNKEIKNVYLCFKEIFEPAGDYEIIKIVGNSDKAKEWVRQEREDGRIHSFIVKKEVE